MNDDDVYEFQLLTAFNGEDLIDLKIAIDQATAVRVTRHLGREFVNQAFGKDDALEYLDKQFKKTASQVSS